MFSISNLGVQFSGIDLFNNISFVINRNDKIGLVGKNGVGKSTLLKIIAQQQKPDAGSVSIPIGKSVGYLPQEIKINSTKSITEETLSVFAEARKLETDIELINKQLTEKTDYESSSYINLINELNEKNDKLLLLDPGKMESKMERVLKGLGFRPSDFKRSISEFSGGWQMRVELAKLLLLMPDLLLLDEPSNHLDIESILWLEDFLKNYDGAIIMVSHDRMFLDNITSRTIEMVNGKIYDYKVPYSKFVHLRNERLEQQEATFNNQQKFIAQQERFIERFRAKNTKAKQVQSKIKRLEKMDRVEFDEVDNQIIRFRFPPAPRSGDVVIEAKNVCKSYGSNQVLNNLDFTVGRGERVAFVGKNGEGKSTLVKLITGEEQFDGQLKTGFNVKVGYYAQVQESTLDDNLTVYNTIDNIATGEWRSISRIRGLLGAFLFGTEDVDKKVKVLSGGEKSRLALAKLLLSPVNLLILDEPTNHLDITAKDILKNALLEYNGTLILVSHDRDFLQGLTNRTFEFGNRKIKDRLGDINEFLDSHHVDSFRAFESTNNIKKESKLNKTDVSSNKHIYLQKREIEKTYRSVKKAVTKCEDSIASIESEIAVLEKQMASSDFYNDLEIAQHVLDKHKSLKEQLEQAMQNWEKLNKEFENLNLKTEE